MATEMTTTKTVTEIVEAIIADGCGVYTTDGGNGCGGPGYLDPDTLQDMLEAEELDDYEFIGARTWDDREETGDIIESTLWAHNDEHNETHWLVAEKVEWTAGCQNNPYRSYLLLWEV